MNRLKLYLPLALFALLAGLLYRGLNNDPTELPSALIGEPFPLFQLESVESAEQRYQLSSLQGEVTLVNVWATWCPTCKAEHAFLNELAKDGVKIVGINYKDDDFKARQWLQAYGNPYLFNIADPDGKLGLELGVYGAPETFLVDSKGIIRAKHIGDLNPAVWAKLQPEFEAMQ